MKSLNANATAILRRIIDGMVNIGDHKKIDNAKGVYMALCVEIIGRHGNGKIVSLAHYHEQNGDLCCDPDCEFLVTGDDIIPMTFQQAIPPIYQRGAWIEGGKLHADLRLQPQIAEFCDMWLQNIAEQQGI